MSLQNDSAREYEYNMLTKQIAELNEHNDLLLSEVWRLRREKKKLLNGIKEVVAAIKEEQHSADKYISSLETQLHRGERATAK